MVPARHVHSIRCEEKIGARELALVARMLSMLSLSTGMLSLSHEPVRVLHRAERFCVVSKPPGIMVHRNKFAKKGEPVLLQMVRDQLGEHIHAVHRLDGGTSGCLVMAFDSEMTAELQAAMQAPTSRKVYLAHCRGDAAWIQNHHETRPLRGDDGIERQASTQMNCLASCEGPERSSLLRCEISTGRWHQIRKHCNGLSHPVLGDAKHGDSRVNRWWRQEREFLHLGLHCHELEFVLPSSGETVHVRAPVRPDLVSVWRELPWWEQAVGAVPSLAEDARDADAVLGMVRAREEHVENPRVVASGRGVSVFHRDPRSTGRV